MKLDKYYENPDILHIGTEKVRAYYIPLTPEGESRLIDLNGSDWRFKWFHNIFDVPTELKDGILEDADTISVPSCVNILGYDRHQYSNLEIPIPFDPPYAPIENPCGAYVKTFEIDDLNELYYLNLDGVDSCFYLWVNGKFAGYSQVAHATSEFNVTKFLKVGQNTISILVLKWCDGTYFEDQDKFRMTGIFRDIYLLKRPANHVRDFYIKTAIAPVAAIDLTIQDYAGVVEELKFELYSPDGTLLKTDAISDAATIKVEDALLWTAETPYLYTLRLISAEEIIEQKVGIRVIEIKDAVLYLNGQNIKFKGVNRHDSDPYTGFCITKEQLLVDLKLMKEHNINAIRTSHYPNSPWAYALYDEYGFYLIAEADIETHNTVHLYNGGRTNYNYDDQIIKSKTFGLLCTDPSYEKTILDRVERCVVREKNHPCVIMWSLGNESGYGPNMEKAAAYIHELDSDFVIHYESSIYEMPDYTNDLSNIDVYSRMYMPVDKVENYCKNNPQKPLVLCEYSCAMGNGPGDLEDYFEKIYEYPSFAGGFVWEWSDHAIYEGKTEQGKEKFLFGGDFGEFPHSGSFCIDGLVYPNRKPHTGLFEYKNVARPIRMTQDADAEETTFIFTNTMDFLNSKDILEIKWELFLDHEKVQEGIIDQNILPHESISVVAADLNWKEKPLIAADMYVIFKYIKTETTNTLPAGFEFGFDQYIIQTVYRNFAGDGTQNIIEESEDEKILVVKSDANEYVFDKLRGTITNVTVDGKSFFEKPLEINIWRAPADNDKRFAQHWKTAGYDRVTTRVYECAAEQKQGYTEVVFKMGVGALAIQNFIALEVRYLVHNNGVLTIIMDGERDDGFPVLPRFGVRMFLAKNFEQVEYLGIGPHESYIDKCRSSYYGKFDATVTELHEDYIVPQENGSHCGCSYISISDQTYSILIAGSSLVFNASHYSAEILERTCHNFELEESPYTVLCIDSDMNGLGSSSCGPLLIEKYRLSNTRLYFNTQFKFIRNEESSS